MMSFHKMRVDRDLLRAANIVLTDALNEIIRYEQDTEWMTHDELPPLAVTECANRARHALKTVKDNT